MTEVIGVKDEGKEVRWWEDLGLRRKGCEILGRAERYEVLWGRC